MRALLRLIRALEATAGRRRFRLALALAVADAALLAVPALIVAWAASGLLDDALGRGRAALAAGAVLLLLGLRYAAMMALRGLAAPHGFALGLALRLTLLDRLVRMPMGALRRRGNGPLVAALVEDARWLQEGAANLLPTLVADLAVPVLLLAGLALLDWPTALSVAVGLALGILAWAVLERVIVLPLAARRGPRLADAAGRVAEYIQGLGTLRAFGQAGTRMAAFRAALDAVLDAYRQKLFLAVALGGLGAALAELGLVLALLWGGARVAAGSLAPATLLAALLVAAAALAFGRGALSARLGLRFAGRAAASLTGLLAEPPLPERAGAAPGEGNAICFREVAFAHEPGRAALRGISFAVPEGGFVALVGPSGAGKSTVLQLLARHADPDAGSILLGGRDLRDWPAAALQRRLAVVAQEVHLFRDSVAANLRLARPEASDAELEAACRAARIHATVARLPQGYATVLGDGGATLSGGERQRVAIARALLKDAPILLLDEATAAVDPENEAEIQAGLRALARGRSLIVVAHRLPTIVEADEILVLDGGLVVERGRHRTLLAAGGTYARLWAAGEAARGWQLRPPAEGERA
jgi:ATP-binding cassette subfamily B protein